MKKVRLFLSGYFQCSPDAFEKQMQSAVVESGNVYSLIKKGYTVVGAEVETSEIEEPKIQSAIANQQTQPEICPRCGGSGRLYMCAEDGDGRNCPKCNGAGKLQASA